MAASNVIQINLHYSKAIFPRQLIHECSDTHFDIIHYDFHRNLCLENESYLASYHSTLIKHTPVYKIDAY